MRRSSASNRCGASSVQSPTRVGGNGPVTSTQAPIRADQGSTDGMRAINMTSTLIGRERERSALDARLREVRAGQSHALVLHGEAGVGKTALLEYLLDQAADCRVVRTAGIESEMELAFAALHQMCTPMLDALGRLPD